MSDVILVALIAAAPGCLATVMASLNQFLARKALRQIEHNTIAVKQLEHNTNGIKEELLKVTGEAEYAKGVKEGESRRGSE